MTDRGWGSKEFAEAWKKKGADRRLQMAEQTEAMFEAAGLRPGMRVLDLGTGTGDTALLAAERVGPGGTVVATDFSPSMVAAATQAVAEAGAQNVTVRQMDASVVDVGPGTFDAVIGRQVLMFTDRPRALAGVVRALRPGGRLGATVWGPSAENEYHVSAIEAGRKRGGWDEASPPQIVRAFSVDETGAWSRWMREAGFVDVSETPVKGERRFASGEEAFAAMKESPIHAEPIERLGDKGREREQAEAWEEMRRLCEARGGVFSTLHLVLSGRKAGG